VGEILAALARTGLAANTLVIFTSDNGPEVAEITPGAYERIRLYGHWSNGRLAGRQARHVGRRAPRAVPGALAGPHSSGRHPASRPSATWTCWPPALAILGTKLPPDAGEDSCNILPRCRARNSDAPSAKPQCCTAAMGPSPFGGVSGC